MTKPEMRTALAELGNQIEEVSKVVRAGKARLNELQQKQRDLKRALRAAEAQEAVKDPATK